MSTDCDSLGPGEGGAAGNGGGYWPSEYWQNRYWPSSFWPHEGVATVAPETGEAVVPEWELRLYDVHGRRMHLPQDWVDEVEFELLEHGGFGTGSFQALASWEELQLRGGERADVWLFGRFAYRGYVTVAQNEVGDPERCSPTLQGLVERFNAFLVRRKFTYAVDTDLSQVFIDLANAYVTTARRFPSVVLSTEDVGVTLREFDAVGRGFSEAVNALCDLAPEQCLWGVDVNSSLMSRLYFRKKRRSVAYRYSVGRNVRAFVYPRDVSSVVNRLYVKGATLDHPNLLTNPSFEDARPSDEVNGNLLLNAGFEDDYTSDDWTRVNDSTPTSGADPVYDGRRSIVCDNNPSAPEGVYQYVAQGDVRPISASVWALIESPHAALQLRVKVEGLNSGGSVVSTTTAVFSFDATDTWEHKQLDVPLATPDPSIVRWRVTYEAESANPSGQNLLIDNASAWYREGVVSFGWLARCYGAATVNALDWASTDVAAKHGDISLKVWPAHVANPTTDYVEVRQARAQRVSVKPNTRYTPLLYYYGSGLSFTYGCREYKSDGTLLATHEFSVSATVTTWELTQAGNGFVTDQQASTVEFFVRVKANNVHYLDALMLVEGPAPDLVVNDGDYWPGSQYERTFTVEDEQVSGELGLEENWALDRCRDTAGVELSLHTPDTGQTWVRKDVFHTGNLVVSEAGRLYNPDSGTGMLYAWSVPPEDFDYEVEADVRFLSHIPGHRLAVVARIPELAPGGEVQGIAWEYNENTGDWELSTFSNIFGTPTGVLAAYTPDEAPELAVRHRLTLRVECDNVEGLVNGVLLARAAFTTLPTTILDYPRRRGYPGLSTSTGSGAAGSETTGAHVDNVRVHAVSRGEFDGDESIDTYGEREAEVTNDDVKDHATALALAKGYLRAHATPQVQARLSLYGPYELLKFDGSVLLLNLPDPPGPLFPSRVRYQVGSDAVTLDADLGSARPDLADLLLRVEQAKAAQR